METDDKWTWEELKETKIVDDIPINSERLGRMTSLNCIGSFNLEILEVFLIEAQSNIECSDEIIIFEKDGKLAPAIIKADNKLYCLAPIHNEESKKIGRFLGNKE